MRRLASLLSGLLLLQLTLVGWELPCAKHGLEQTRQSPHHGMVEHQHQASQAAASDRSDTSDDAPAVPACCRAFASCGISPLDDPAEGAPKVAVINALVRAVAEDVPSSWSAEPDSPPPKA